MGSSRQRMWGIWPVSSLPGTGATWEADLLRLRVGGFPYLLVPPPRNRYCTHPSKEIRVKARLVPTLLLTLASCTPVFAQQSPPPAPPAAPPAAESSWAPDVPEPG